MNLKGAPQAKELIQICGVAALYYAFIGQENYPKQIEMLVQDVLYWQEVDSQAIINTNNLFSSIVVRMEC